MLLRLQRRLEGRQRPLPHLLSTGLARVYRLPATQATRTAHQRVCRASGMRSSPRRTSVLEGLELLQLERALPLAPGLAGLPAGRRRMHALMWRQVDLTTRMTVGSHQRWMDMQVAAAAQTPVAQLRATGERVTARAIVQRPALAPAQTRNAVSELPMAVLL